MIEKLLTRYVPRKVMLDAESIEATPAALALLADWLEATEHLDAARDLGTLLTIP